MILMSTTHLSSALSQRVEVVALAVIVCGLIFELVRRKHLMERYAILWLVLLTTLSHAVGIYYPPSALFAVAFLFVLVMLVHFSMTVSRLSDQNTILAQRLALLQQRLEEELGEPLKHTPESGKEQTVQPVGAEHHASASTDELSGGR
jgi:hypothetical protein